MEPEQMYPIFAILTILMLYSTITLLTGWHGLAKKYPYAGAIETGEELKTFKRNDLKIGANGRYKSCVTVTLHEKGIKLVPFPILRPFHPPIFIHWKEMHQVQLVPHPYLRKKFEFYAQTTRLCLYSKTAVEIARQYKNKKEDVFG